MKQDRVEILDSFRFIAILAVMLLHFTIRWAPPFYPVNLYPYGNFFGETFYYGGMGVQFFFIISGFVIAFTLERTTTPGAFLKNRFIRLFPAMLLCSLFTYLIGLSLDSQNFFPYSHTARNFLPSLTFTKPEIWQSFMHKSFENISYSYWSLWVEVQFYVLAAFLFFLNRKTFLRNLIIVAVVFGLLENIPETFFTNEHTHHLPGWIQQILHPLLYLKFICNIQSYISWFAIGAFFHYLYKKGELSLKSPVIPGMLFILWNNLHLLDGPRKIIFLVMMTLFILLVFGRKWLAFLENKLFYRLGVISYSAYLIHDSSGTLLINKYGGYLGKWSPFSLLIMIVLVFLFADLSYRLYEKRAASFLKRLLFRSKRQPKEMALEPVVSK